MYRRNLTPRILAALADTPIVMLHGARQTGKTTLVRSLAEGEHRAAYLTLDSTAVLAAAENDPAGFLDGLEAPVILDEIQRAPGLFLPLKERVDRDRRPGQFLLTGSAHALLLPKLADSLAGRMETLTLRPLSQGEQMGHVERFIDGVFQDRLPPLRAEPDPDSLEDRILAGGYPEAIARGGGKRRGAWFGSYLTAILQRDVRDLASVERLGEFPKLLRLIAARSGSPVNYSSLARDAGIPNSTFKRYVALMEATFLIDTVAPWHANIGKRLMKSPKMHISDSGLAAHLLGATPERLRKEPSLAGPLLEAFVLSELRKQASWSEIEVEIHHLRTMTGQEVDLVLEDARGRLVGIEVKTSRSLRGDAFRGLHALADMAGKRFHRGVVLHGGDDVVPQAKNLHALPINALWRM